MDQINIINERSMAYAINLPSICIVAQNAYGVLAGVDTGHMGGIEVQTPLMAKWLAKKGYRVSMVTWDERDLCIEHVDGQVIDGVTVYKLCRREDGLPVVRFLYPRWSSLNSALERANPDIVYYNCGDLGLGQVVAWARRRHRRVLYSVANDKDCLSSLPGLKPLRERLLYRYGITKADKIVVQTRKQQHLLQTEFGQASKVIPMPCQGVDSLHYNRATNRRNGDPLKVLWIGRFANQKRLEWLLDLAAICPEVQFNVLGGANTETNYSSMLKFRAESLSNVTLHGRVKHSEISKFYQTSDILCCTSTHEGFPNVFLEAWSLGVPIVTTFDPDDVVKTYGIGIVASNVDELKCGIFSLSKIELWEQASMAAKKYFEQFHRVESSMKLFSEEIRELMDEKPKVQ
jgi:glycosyltransferase involved in cell wall biosynthesis